MAHENFAEGNPSPPLSHHDGHSPPGYNHTLQAAHSDMTPYTPPRSQPGQGYSYDDPEHYEMTYAPSFYDQPRHHQSGGYRTPPQAIGAGMQTRSGRALGTPTTAASSPASRASASPRTKRNKKGKEQPPEIDLRQPLSVETKDYDVPVRDMMAWANRPHYERHQEVGKQHKGKTPRPLNSFMLYRQAYKERIKKWGEQGNNNQLISRVAGHSWNIEPQEVKDFYARVSVVERDNHTAAFPEYKFAPNKNIGKKRGRKDDDDDSDSEWDGSSEYGSKRRRGRDDSASVRSRSATPAHITYSSPQYHPSTLQAIHSQFMPPEPHYQRWAQPVIYDQYYGYPMAPYHEVAPDLHYAPRSMPVVRDQQYMQLVGMPPNSEAMVETLPTEQVEYAVDPSLNEIGASASYQYVAYPEFDHHGGLEREQEHVPHPGMQTLVAAEPMWSPDGAAGSAFDTELDNHWHGDS